jgi:hypothetical protein
MAKGISQAEINRISEQGVRLLRADRKDPVVVNLENALALGQPLPLDFRGTEYRVRPLSYRNGLELERAEKSLNRWRSNPAQNVDEVDEHEIDLLQTLALFHSLLEPVPESNPFLDASPSEVGELLGFFFACLMIQGALSRSAVSHSPSSTN